MGWLRKISNLAPVQPVWKTQENDKLSLWLGYSLGFFVGTYDGG